MASPTEQSIWLLCQKWLKYVAVFALIFLLAGCRLGTVGRQTAVTPSSAVISLTDAWGRPSPPLAETAAFYLTIHNNSDKPDKLVGVETAVCDLAQLHTSLMENEVMTMHPVADVDLPAHSGVILEPGGVHIMCLGLTQPLQAGDELPLLLTFAESGVITVTAVIREE